ncbi:TPA: hypothetical protein N0F65_002111 [Lagenidium giganteum]|uniref:AAA+ ATPase domain-containing protein n=1 Tax=Lagenidium giganteum TaxID=4803 RepID=A0AAV2ZHM0_9STRA|nr:TPA: hypothetical protein N0F65_002111 [Lagenidium giganteum]
MLWVDKYRPTSLDTLDYHEDVTRRLKNLAHAEDLPHLLVYGPSGAGKKTRIMALLRELYGDGALKVRLEHKSFKVPNRSTKVEITTVASNYHIEMNPSDVGNQDRLVVQEVLKEIAQYHLADTNSKRQFKVVLLMEVDRLSKNAQAALRRTMEKYTATCRLVLCCNNPSKVIDPLRSRCLGIRIGAPAKNEICNILQAVCSKEGLNYSAPLGNEIANKSDRNLRRAILMLETCRVQCYPFAADQVIQLPAWEEYICSLAKVVLQDQSPAGLLKSREMIYELMANCIPSEVILKVLCRELMSRLDDDLKHELMHWAAYYEHRMQRGSKDIFHFEAFIAKFMMLYKKFLLELYILDAIESIHLIGQISPQPTKATAEMGAHWDLYVVTRCAALQTCLSAPDRDAISAVVGSEVHEECGPSTQQREDDAATGNSSSVTSAHLERWRKWKLDDSKIQELTTAGGADVVVPTAVRDAVDGLEFFARGKRGVLHSGTWRHTGLPVVVKMAAGSAAAAAATSLCVNEESKWLRVLNRMGIGAQLVAAGPGWFVCERLDGQHIVDFLTTIATPSLARWVVREILCQCFTMDSLGINKDEMTHPMRHIIVHRKQRLVPTQYQCDAAMSRQEKWEWKCTFIDFERCSYTKKPKNVTQICQFLGSPRMQQLLQAQGLVIDVQRLRQCAKAFKQTQSSTAFDQLLNVFR